MTISSVGKANYFFPIHIHALVHYESWLGQIKKYLCFRFPDLPLFLPPTLTLFIVSESVRGNAGGRRHGEVYFYRNLASVCTIRSASNAQKLNSRPKKLSMTSLINDNIMNFCAFIMDDDHDISIRVSNKKKKKKKKFRPTYPNFLGHVTRNTHTFLFGFKIKQKNIYLKLREKISLLRDNYCVITRKDLVITR